MQQNQQKPQIGVSACLMGHQVRFDGGHKRSHFVLDQCSEYFGLHPVCPEAELGLGIPRPTIQLRQYEAEVRLVYSKQPDNDLTDKMQAFSSNRVRDLSKLHGFIFKKDSPSCGVERVPVFSDRTGMRERNGTGIFAAEFMKQYPHVPVEEEGRLNDIKLRENFLERVYAYYRWTEIDSTNNPLTAFREFHRDYKLILMAKNTQAYQRLGRLVASVNRENLYEIRQKYIELFMQVMTKIATRGQHVNVLMHIMGYLKDKLSSKDKAELLEWFEIYRDEQVSRVTPLALLRHHLNNYPHGYIEKQYYFSPCPETLMRPV